MHRLLTALLVADVAAASSPWTARDLEGIIARTAQPEGMSPAGVFFMHGTAMAAVPFFLKADPHKRNPGETAVHR